MLELQAPKVSVFEGFDHVGTWYWIRIITHYGDSETCIVIMDWKGVGTGMVGVLEKPKT